MEKTTVLFSTRHHPNSFLRQISGSNHHWNDYHFILPEKANDLSTRIDWLVVYDDPSESLKTNVPKSRRILFIAEPPSIKIYAEKYLNQFSIVVCPYFLKGFKGKQIISHTSLPWHFAVKKNEIDDVGLNYDSLSSMNVPVKQNKISVVCSKKTMNEFHVLRLAFIEKLKLELGDQLVIYGRGFNEIADKAEAIIPYQFHLVLENNNEDHFWTEKLADSYLGFSYPIYSGCNNINKYFSDNAISLIDITDPEKAIIHIKNIVNTSDFYKNRQSAIINSRNKVLNDYNVFNVIADIIKNENSIDINFSNLKKIYRNIDFYPLTKIKDILYAFKSNLFRKFAIFSKNGI